MKFINTYLILFSLSSISLRAREESGVAKTADNTTLMGSSPDPNFDAVSNALYYVRVLEIPTPRWSIYDAVKYNLGLMDDVPATIQESAWSSPIWYSPI